MCKITGIQTRSIRFSLLFSLHCDTLIRNCEQKFGFSGIISGSRWPVWNKKNGLSCRRRPRRKIEPIMTISCLCRLPNGPNSSWMPNPLPWNSPDFPSRIALFQQIHQNFLLFQQFFERPPHPPPHLVPTNLGARNLLE